MKNTHFPKLQKIIVNAYAPYSNFRTAAMVLTDVGEFFGTNVENAAYPSGICAERNAIFTAIAHGAKKINELHLLTDSEKSDVVPCAACLQVLREFSSGQTMVYVYSKSGKMATYKFSDLLPHSFSKTNLVK